MQNYNENKINRHNFIDYSYRIFFIIASDILVSWIKTIIIFKFSGFKANMIKMISFEFSVFHEKLKYDCFNTNGKPSHQYCSNYVKILENYNFLYINQKKLERYSNYLDNDCILNNELRNNIIIPCVIVLSLILDKFTINFFKIIMFLMIILILRRLIQLNISIHTLDRIDYPKNTSIPNNKSGYTSDNSVFSEHSL